MLEFKQLYETYATEVYRFSLWLAREGADAEDITSETFVRAWSRRDDIRTETLKAYLFTIARNIYLEGRRKARHHKALEDVHPDPGPGPDRLLETQMELERVCEILRRLPEDDRAAFVMRTEHGLPYEEIARVLGLSLSSAKVKVHRVRRKLLTDRIKREGSQP
ncbi:MAG: sigma-70 family RNA polymerase sigma factor [bacterium]|jgi:RNA polymerase sigma-70 factor (ECF subfamily)